MRPKAYLSICVYTHVLCNKVRKYLIKSLGIKDAELYDPINFLDDDTLNRNQSFHVLGFYKHAWYINFISKFIKFWVLFHFFQNFRNHIACFNSISIYMEKGNTESSCLGIEVGMVEISISSPYVIHMPFHYIYDSAIYQ